MTPANLIRSLVVAGTVMLIVGCGTTTDDTIEVPSLDNETIEPPHLQIVPQANGDFACDLFHKLAEDRPNENLFFSPHSISTVLAMAAEGARGKTADEMGAVLRLPAGARQTGDDVERMPWRMSLVSNELAQLEQWLLPPADDSNTKALRARIAKLRAELDSANDTLKGRYPRDGKKPDFTESYDKASQLADALNELYPKIDSYELNLANSLWIEKDYPFVPEFKKTISESYRAGGAFACDFRNRPDAQRKKINDWAEKKTRGRIRNLLPEGSVDGLTRFALVNAAYFQGRWAEPFDVDRTSPLPFTKADGSKKDVSMMIDRKYHARYGAFLGNGKPFHTPHEVTPLEKGGYEEATVPGDDGFVMLEMPYQGEKLSMVLIAPMNAARLPDVARPLSGEKLKTWIGALESRKVDVLLPRVQFETSYALADRSNQGVLQRLGMLRAFTDPTMGSPEQGADFSGISTADPLELYISNVYHKAFVAVQEKGTEAAAATVAVGKAAAGRRMIEKVPFIPTFNADRPFLFLIRDVKTGVILFFGRVMDPQSPTGNRAPK